MPQTVEVPGYGAVEFPDGMSDDQIASAIKANMPQPAQKQYRMEDTVPGPGGKLYNQDGTEFTAKSAPAPTSDRWADKLADVGNNLGISPITDPLIGGAEAALSGGTNLFGKVTGGLAGAGQMMLNPFSDPNEGAANTSRGIEDYLTYKPGRSGQDLLSPVAKGGETVMRNLPQDPASQTLVPAFADLVSSLAPLKAGVTGGVRALERIPIGKAAVEKPPIPTTEQLGKAASEAYQRADESGISMKAESFDKMKNSLVEDLTKGGIDPTLHPKATAALKRLSAEEGPVTLQKAETLRRVALDAQDTLEKSDARNAGKIVDALDDYIDNLSNSDLVSGKATDAAALKEARALYTRKRKSEDIERLVERAKLSPSGFENGLRIEFRSLSKNDRKFKRFNPEEQAAIKKVAMGGVGENALRLLGKAAPTGIVSGGLSSGAGFAFGGPAGAIALPAAGIAGRIAAKALTTRNARLAGEIMRKGPLPVPQAPRGLLANTLPEALQFSPTPGVMPAKAAAMSRGLDFPPSPVANPAQLPPVPSRITADIPPRISGGLPFKNYLPVETGNMAIAGQSPRYPGGLDFTPSELSKGLAEKMSGGLGLLGETPATPAKGRMGLLDLPQKPRPAKQVRSEIRSLSERIRTELAGEDASSPKLQQALSELQSLQRELEASQANR